MSNSIEIANRALMQAGTRGQIAALDEPSKEARACNLLFGSTRDIGLSLAPWDFARGSAVLALLSAAPGTAENPNPPRLEGWTTASPMPPWLYMYSQPQDNLIIRYILPQFDGKIYPPARFVKASTVVSGARIQVILTNAPKAIGVYTVRMEDPESWSAPFTEMVVFALAARLALPLSGDKQLAAGNLQAANSMLVEARVTDGNESFNQQIDILPDWIRARDSLPFPYEPPDPLAYVGLFQLG